MFFHKREPQYRATPEHPDAAYARKLQEVLGGQYGAITLAMQYSFQAWNAHLPGKYRDLIFDIGTEEFGHVEMLATMIARLSEAEPHEFVEETAQSDSIVSAVLGGTDIEQAVLAGVGARPVDGAGNPWSGSYITATGNLIVDFKANATAEMQGRLQLAELYRKTDDHGVRDLLSFLLARDTVHQNQWLAATMDLEKENLKSMAAPGSLL